MPLSFPETERPALIVGQDGILRAGWQPAPNVQFTRGSGGLPTRRRLPTCPTTCAEFADLGKPSGIGPSACHARLRAFFSRLLDEAEEEDLAVASGPGCVAAAER